MASTNTPIHSSKGTGSRLQNKDKGIRVRTLRNDDEARLSKTPSTSTAPVCAQAYSTALGMLVPRQLAPVGCRPCPLLRTADPALLIHHRPGRLPVVRGRLGVGMNSFNALIDWGLKASFRFRSGGVTSGTSRSIPRNRMCIWTATVMAFSSHCFLSPPLLLLLLMNGSMSSLGESVSSPIPRARRSALLAPMFPTLPVICYKSAEAVN